MSSILVTGGAGFIGSFIVDELIKKGHSVRIFDNLAEHVHRGKKPAYLNKQAEFVLGDVRNYDEFADALSGIDVVFHEASLVGIEPSMRDVKFFVDVNCTGTANLLDIIIKKSLNVKKLIIPGSVAIYGESLYECDCGKKKSEFRKAEQLTRKEWGIYCDGCGKEMNEVKIPESKKPYLNNIYSLTKYDQEAMCLAVGKQHSIPVSVLRYFNVYGPRQSVINPYSGVVTKFIDSVLKNKELLIFEDGNQSRDFINVKDIAAANILAMERSNADYQSFNVGSGNQTTVKEIAEIIIESMDSDIKPKVTEKFRVGDMRNCTADITRIRKKLGFEPGIGLKEGIKEVIEWQKNLI